MINKKKGLWINNEEFKKKSLDEKFYRLKIMNEELELIWEDWEYVKQSNKPKADDGK